MISDLQFRIAGEAGYLQFMDGEVITRRLLFLSTTIYAFCGQGVRSLKRCKMSEA